MQYENFVDAVAAMQMKPSQTSDKKKQHATIYLVGTFGHTKLCPKLTLLGKNM